jgi:hypothetical protein
MVDDVFERFAEPGRSFARFGGDIRIERQGGSHAGIMMRWRAPSRDRSALQLKIRDWPPYQDDPPSSAHQAIFSRMKSLGFKDNPSRSTQGL